MIGCIRAARQSCAGGRWIAPAAVAALAVIAATRHSASAADALADAGTAARTVEIGIDNFTFAPAEVTIAPGTTVKWVNHDDIPHAVTEKGLAFKSKPLDTDDAFSHVFEKVGEVQYFCSLHPRMVGRITVK